MNVVRGLAAICGVLLAASAFAGRPLNVNDAAPLDPQDVQVETGVDYARDEDLNVIETSLAVSYGVSEMLELGAGWGVQREYGVDGAGMGRGEHGVSDVVLAAKVKIADERGLRPAFSVAPAVKLPTADDGVGLGTGGTDAEAFLIASKTLLGDAAVHLNLGYARLGDSDNEGVPDSLHYGVAVEHQLASFAQWTGEVFAERERVDASETVARAHIGFRAVMGPEWTADIAIGTGLAGDAEGIGATVGLTGVFGLW